MTRSPSWGHPNPAADVIFRFGCLWDCCKYLARSIVGLQPRLPRWKNAVRSGDACRLLHRVGDDHDREVLAQFIDQFFNLVAVAIGSSAEHGSSIRITSGLTAIARAMHRRCCWPPDKPVSQVRCKTLVNFVPTIRHVFKLVFNPISSSSLLLILRGHECGDSIGRHSRRSILEMGLVFERPCRRCARNSTTSTVWAVNVRSSSSVDVAGYARNPSMTSFMRFRQRRYVDFPQPDGPIKCGHLSFAGISRLTS